MLCTRVWHSGACWWVSSLSINGDGALCTGMALWRVQRSKGKGFRVRARARGGAVVRGGCRVLLRVAGDGRGEGISLAVAVARPRRHMCEVGWAGL